ncbi:MAG: DUF4126 domain-containing protein [Actinomycetota bacterium]|nr:DUF4126 domain-containing protein [Actinomycetota bacterium]
MDLFATIFSTGWASGVNAYATVALLGILGRAGLGDVPEPLQSDPAIAAASIMFLIEFVTDKIPYVDNLWDTVHTVVRPSIASGVGALYGVDADLDTLDEAFAAGGSGLTALASHGVKAAIRLGINTSPEPASNIIVSLGEDGAVAGVILLAIEHPVIAAVIAAVLLLLGIALVVFIAKRIRRGLARWRERRRGPPLSN